MSLFRTFISLLLVCSILAANAARADEPIKKTTSAIVSAPVGAIVGLGRGSISKAAQYADAFSNDFGDGLVSKLIGIPSGVIVGGVAGGVTGLLRGLVNGIRISTQEPFSAEAMSLDGNFLDFDPFDFSGTY